MGYGFEKKAEGIYRFEGVLDDKPPDKVVKVSDNEVYAEYGNIRQTWTASGSGTQRYDFKETITEVTV